MPVRHALLGLLRQRPRHGYELHAAFTALVGGSDNWDVKPAQVYTTLARLAEANLVQEDCVEKDGGPDKHIYSLTPAGEEELDRWLTNGVLPTYQRDEFYLKLLLGLDRKDINTRQVIHAQRDTLYRELHRVTTQRQHTDPSSELAHVMLLDKSIMYLEADLRWLDMIEGRLDEMARQPLPEPEVRPRGRPPKN